MVDDPALKRRFLARAEAQAELPEFARCLAVTQLICEARAFGVRAEAEIFQAAYGDPNGRKYWDAHLSEAIPAVLLANILSFHLAESVESFEYQKFATICAFRDAAAAGECWVTGETAPLFVVEYGQTNFGELGKVEIHPRAAVEWLLSKPKRKHLVPDSLRRHLDNASPGEISSSSQACPSISSDAYAQNGGCVEKRARGRKPKKLGQVKTAMRADLQQRRRTLADLQNMHEKDLAAAYGVSRDTARKARNAVVAEFVENSILDK